MKSLMLVFLVISVLVFAAWGAFRVYENIAFNRSCEGYLKRAAESNTVELAKENLGVALKYLQWKGCSPSSGYTSIVLTTPDEDVGFWYSNLVASLTELESLSSEATSMEKSNVLMKLEKTILEHDENGTKVIFPKGISVFPHNRLCCAWAILSLVFAVVFFAWISLLL